MSTFMEKLSSMLKIDGDHAKKFLDACDMSDVVELSSAVSDHDIQTATDLYHKVIAKTNHYIGEPVNVGGERAIITKLDQPGDTVEIAKNGEREMIDNTDIEDQDLKEDVNLLMEDVFGLTSIPGIARLGVLAGLKPQGAVGPGETNDVNTDQNGNKNIGSPDNNPKAQPVSNQPAGSNIPGAKPVSGARQVPGQPNTSKAIPGSGPKPVDDDEENQNVQEDVKYVSLDEDENCPANVCMKALEALEDHLDDIKISELSLIRHRLLKLVNHLNENISFTGRSKKI